MKYCYFILILSYSPFLLVSFLPADFLVNPRFYFTIVNYFSNNIVKTMVNAGCSLVFIFPRIKLNIAGRSRMRTGASGNVEGGTGTGSDFLREMAGKRYPHTVWP